MKPIIIGLSFGLLLALVGRPTLGQITLQATIKPEPLVVQTATITVDCSWAAGTVVWQPTAMSGGNGKIITWSLSGVSYLTINPSTGVISVASGGIPASSCGQTVPFTVTPSQ